MYELELYNVYQYSYLEEWFDEYIKDDPNASWDEIGEFEMGKSFIIITHTKTYSFVMCAYNDKGSVYKLIFKE